MGREFVFVHGMSHGAWRWEPVATRLERRGHRTLAVDLPGHGRRAHGVVIPKVAEMPSSVRPLLEGLARNPEALVAILERV